MSDKVEPIMLGFLPRLSYFIYYNCIYRIVDVDREFIYLKGVRKINHIYVNLIMVRLDGQQYWHETKNREIKELPMESMVIPCHIGPIFDGHIIGESSRMDG